MILKNSLTNELLNVKVPVINVLEEEDIYEYIIITVQKTQIDGVLPVIQKNKSKNIVFVVNNPLGYDHWIDCIGYERMLIGFPAAGGENKNGVVHYFIGTGINKLFQSTTFGELNGQYSQRLKGLIKLFKKSGFSPSVSKNMDWWQKTHVAVILPIAKALYRYNSDNYELSKSNETLKNMVLATRECFQILKDNHVKITPKKLYFYYLPVCLIRRIWQIIMRTKIAEYAMAKHTIVAKDEIKRLEEEYMSLNTKGNKLEHYFKI
ncbi:MAG: hypothetical protein LBQ54_00010 [Planctomycetaceae bacterium]|nr:hypothetical protein [Planctomycetaceae bacterium]